MQAGSLIFLLTPLREGRPGDQALCHWHLFYFYSRPCGRGDVFSFSRRKACSDHFYSRPCGRGDVLRSMAQLRAADFYSRPCGRGDEIQLCSRYVLVDFYSRPCGRGDTTITWTKMETKSFLLTPLREGRPKGGKLMQDCCHFYSRPCGRGDIGRCPGLR